MTDTDRLAAIRRETLDEINEAGLAMYRAPGGLGHLYDYLDLRLRLMEEVAAGVTVAQPAEEPSCCELACYEDPGCACEGCAQPDGLDVERVAAFLHDEYGCRVTCRGGRLADDRHPSHNEAYRGQAERLIAATGKVTGDALVLDGPCDDQCRHD